MHPHPQASLPPTHTHAPWPGDETHLLRPRSHVLPCLLPAGRFLPVPGMGPADPMSPSALGPLLQTRRTRVASAVAAPAGDRHLALAPAAAVLRASQPEPAARGPWPLSPASSRSFFLLLPLRVPPAPTAGLRPSSEPSPNHRRNEARHSRCPEAPPGCSILRRGTAPSAALLTSPRLGERLCARSHLAASHFLTPSHVAAAWTRVGCPSRVGKKGLSPSRALPSRLPPRAGGVGGGGARWVL